MKLYVYYDPWNGGNILAICPAPQSDMGIHVVIDTPACDALYMGKALIATHKIIHGVLTDNVTDLLINHGSLPEPNPTTHNFSHQRVFHIPTVTELDPTVDLTIENNTATKTTTVTLGPWADANAMSSLRLFFTDRDDLYSFRRQLMIGAWSSPYRWTYVGDLTKCSAWTYRIFETYQYREHHTPCSSRI